MNKNIKAVRLYITQEMRDKIINSGSSVARFVSQSVIDAHDTEFLSLSAHLDYTMRPKVKPMRISLKKEIYSLIKDTVKLKKDDVELELKVNKSKYVNICVYHYLDGLGNEV